MGNKALGAIELVPKRSFYDYKAKYSSKAKTEHIMPARLSPVNYKKALSLGKRAHKVLRCRGVTRSDFRFYKKKFYLLEINTQPGMTKLSLVPEIANYCKIKFEDLVVWMLNDASNNRMNKFYRIFLLLILLIFLSTFNPFDLNLLSPSRTSFFNIKIIEVENNTLISKEKNYKKS